jgi:hypothetical protein
LDLLLWEFAVKEGVRLIIEVQKPDWNKTRVSVHNGKGIHNPDPNITVLGMQAIEKKLEGISLIQDSEKSGIFLPLPDTQVGSWVEVSVQSKLEDNPNWIAEVKLKCRVAKTLGIYTTDFL